METAMTFEEASHFLLDLASQRGTAIEVFAQRESSTNIKSFNREVSEFSLADKVGVGVRALVNGAWGYAYTENLSATALRRAFASAVENAELVAPEEHARLSAWPEAPAVEGLFNPGLAEVGVDAKVRIATTLESAARDADPRVKSVPYATYEDGNTEVTIANSEGLDRSFKSNYAYQFVAPLVEENGQNKMKWDWQFTRDFATLDPTETALEAVTRSVALLGAKPVTSGSYPVVIENECMASFLATFSAMFNAKMVQEGKSPLAGKLGQSLAASRVTIIDDATLDGGLASRPFDDEGCPSRPITLIRAGTLHSYLHNSETASKDGVESTGHAQRGSYKGALNISPTNLYLQPDTGERDALFAGLNRAILLTAISGAHAGANIASGDFSLQAEGFLIEDGQIAYPIEVFTVAGNFLEMLNEIEAIGDDLKFSWNGVGSPSVRVKSLAVGGQ